MITLETQVTGGQLAHQLMGDEEEFCYLLDAIAEDAGDRFLQDVSEAAQNVNTEELVMFLRKLATSIEAHDLPLAA